MRGRVVVGRGCRHSHGVGRQISGCRVDGVLGRGWEARGGRIHRWSEGVRAGVGPGAVVGTVLQGRSRSAAGYPVVGGFGVGKGWESAGTPGGQRVALSFNTRGGGLP